MTVLDTSDPNLLRYGHGLLQLEVPGGVKLEGLDRMRVTLKVALKDSPRPPLRHNLDLYNDNQLEKFIRRVAERLEVGTSVIAASLSELTGQLEGYRLDQLRQQQGHHPAAKPLTAEQQQAAKEHLRADNLLEQTMADLQGTGIQGEAVNSLILLLAMSSRKLADPLSVICLAGSGTGKSYLMEQVGSCIPDEDKREHTQFSGNSFYYYRREEIRGKVFLIEDLDGAQAVLFPIRELQTKKRISKTVTLKDRGGQLRTTTLVVEGPVSVIGCTTRERVYEDNANRALLLYLDDSGDQDARIMDYQKRCRAGLVDVASEKRIREQLRDMQRMLQPVRVINPYAPLIALPGEVFKPRRTLPLLLSFIEAITFYCQYQRETRTDQATGELYTETHPEDIEWAFKLLGEVLLRKSDELSGAARAFYEWLKGWQEGRGVPLFYAAELRAVRRIHPRTLNRYLQELTEYGFLQVAGGNRHRTGYAYRLTGLSSSELLRGSIVEQTAGVLEKVWSAYRARLGGGVAGQRVKRSPSRPGSSGSKPAGHVSDSGVSG